MLARAEGAVAAAMVYLITATKERSAQDETVAAEIQAEKSPPEYVVFRGFAVSGFHYHDVIS